MEGKSAVFLWRPGGVPFMRGSDLVSADNNDTSKPWIYFHTVNQQWVRQVLGVHAPRLTQAPTAPFRWKETKDNRIYFRTHMSNVSSQQVWGHLVNKRFGHWLATDFCVGSFTAHEDLFIWWFAGLQWCVYKTNFTLMQLFLRQMYLHSWMIIFHTMFHP